MDNLIIKDFPTGKLTVPALEAYLDTLEVTERFIPDLLIIDYPDLMTLRPDIPIRLAIDETYKDLRGLAVARNIAVAAVSQSNRSGSGVKTVTGKHVAEAYSKWSHCDTGITYSQTDGEKKLGLARLRVEAGRHDQDGIEIVIAQQYGVGNFSVSSAVKSNDYWQMINLVEQDVDAEIEDVDNE